MSAGLVSILLIGAVAAIAGVSLIGQTGVDSSPSPAAAVQTRAPASKQPPTVTPTSDSAQSSGGASASSIEPVPGWSVVPPVGMVRATGVTPLPDVAGALPADDGAPPLPPGIIVDVPNPDRLDFLSHYCTPECFRDAQWVDPRDARLGSGTWTAGRPFHVREGFVNESGVPLGEGFSVVLYVTRLEGDTDEPTYRYTPDYVLQGTSDRCGPAYTTQTAPTTCQWFVHDFPKGLPEGRWAMWAVWEAPCRAWLEYGLISWCDDADRVMALFASGFDAPYGAGDPDYDEVTF